MLIARKGNFGLMRGSLINGISKTHDLEIIKFSHPEGSEKDCNFVIASFNCHGEIVSCENRLFESINSIEELETVKNLSKIAELIIVHTDGVIIK